MCTLCESVYEHYAESITPILMCRFGRAEFTANSCPAIRGGGALLSHSFTILCLSLLLCSPLLFTLSLSILFLSHLVSLLYIYCSIFNVNISCSFICFALKKVKKPFSMLCCLSFSNYLFLNVSVVSLSQPISFSMSLLSLFLNISPSQYLCCLSFSISLLLNVSIISLSESISFTMSLLSLFLNLSPSQCH